MATNTLMLKRRLPTSSALGNTPIHPLLAHLLQQRGVTDGRDTIYENKHLLPPQGLRGTFEAATLLRTALLEGYKTVVVADYDCDGATACVVALRGLKSMAKALGSVSDNFCFMVPDRQIHGYGLTPAIVQEVWQRHRPQLIITVDNGIASVAGVDAARALGIKVLITDHHLAGDVIPAADVIVNPNLKSCNFASKNIAGVGVMFYVLLALRQLLREQGHFDSKTQPNLAALLHLVALGTLADVVRLDYNNRILVHQGLEQIRRGRAFAGVLALLHIGGRNPMDVTASDMGFAVAPRINAAGRLADMTLGINCLLTDDSGYALTLAQRLDNVNQERKEIEATMQEQAEHIIRDLPIPSQKSICVFHPSWHIGVVGIVAGRLKEHYHRPTLVFAYADDSQKTLRASGRSVDFFHLRDALDAISKRAPAMLQTFGGHAMAAGLTLAKEHLQGFSQAFEQQAAAADLPTQRLWECDGVLENAYHNVDVARLLRAQVWGSGFAPPMFYGEFTVVTQKILKASHLKLTLERDGAYFDAIWFRQNSLQSDKIAALYTLDINTFNGLSKVQLLIEVAVAAGNVEWCK